MMRITSALLQRGKSGRAGTWSKILEHGIEYHTLDLPSEGLRARNLLYLDTA